MRTFKLTLQYDGTDYVGWQRQAAGTSIQALLEDALVPIEGGRVVVHGAGRTDAGVHALGQVASFSLAASIPVPQLARALNAVLPPDVRVSEARQAPEGFHARFDAIAKVYQYRFLNGPYATPFLRRYALHVLPALDVPAMRSAAAALIGEHDFAAFQGSGSDVHTSVRTVRRLEWRGGASPEDLLVMEIEANGFLRHMVRNIAGTMLEVGVGRRPAAAMAAILACGDRRQAGRTAPAHGLLLRQVLYSQQP